MWLCAPMATTAAASSTAMSSVRTARGRATCLTKSITCVCSAGERTDGRLRTLLEPLSGRAWHREAAECPAAGNTRLRPA